MKKLILILIILAIPIAVFVYLGQKGGNGKTTLTEILNNTKVNKSKDVEDLTTSAWIPYWDYSRGLETLKNNKGSFNSISPVIYEVNEDGSLKQTKPDQWKELHEYAKENDIDFIPSIAMFDHELFTKVLQSDENLERHIKAIITEIEENEFDGIDLDYESTKLADKNKYEEFIINFKLQISNLEKKLDKKLIFSVTVLPKWGIETIYPSLSETRQVQDWKFLSEHADEIRIMAYDYTSQYSQYPGPIAPLNWIELILEKATNEIAEEKIVLGLHNYGYNWAAGEVNDAVDFLSNPPTEKIRADAYTIDQVQEILDTYPGNEGLEETWGERIYAYKREGNDRVLIFVTDEGIVMRKELAAKYGIKGVSFWRLGGDEGIKY